MRRAADFSQPASRRPAVRLSGGPYRHDLDAHGSTSQPATTGSKPLWSQVAKPLARAKLTRGGVQIGCKVCTWMHPAAMHRLGALHVLQVDRDRGDRI